MPHSRADAMRVEERRAQVAALVAQGLRPSEIAAQVFGEAGAAARVKVSQDLKAIRKAWAASAVRDWDAEKGRVLAELAQLKRELWEDYDLSRKDKKGNPRPGDPRLAAQLLACIGQEVDILGLAPKRGTEPSTSPPIIGFKIHVPNGANGGTTVEGAVVQLPATPAPVCGLKELPLGADPAEYELVEEETGNGEGLATEEGGPQA
jgi:hypothetical protein